MSAWKPFITDIVVSSAATPTVTPATPMSVVTTAKSPLRLALQVAQRDEQLQAHPRGLGIKALV